MVVFGGVFVAVLYETEAVVATNKDSSFRDLFDVISWAQSDVARSLFPRKVGWCWCWCLGRGGTGVGVVVWWRFCCSCCCRCWVFELQ